MEPNGIANTQPLLTFARGQGRHRTVRLPHHLQPFCSLSPSPCSEVLTDKRRAPSPGSSDGPTVSEAETPRLDIPRFSWHRVKRRRKDVCVLRIWAEVTDLLIKRKGDVSSSTDGVQGSPWGASWNLESGSFSLSA